MDNKEFTKQVSICRDKMLRLARGIGLSVNEAEDVVQDAFLKMWVVRDRIDSEKIVSLALSITRNLSIDIKRMQMRHRTESILNKVDAADNNNPHLYLVEKDNNQLLRKAVTQLPDTCRIVLLMRQQDGLKIKDIAIILGTTESSVRGLLCRARKLMFEQLKKSGL